MLRTVLDPVKPVYIVYHLYPTLPSPALPFPSHGAGTSVSRASAVVMTWFLYTIHINRPGSSAAMPNRRLLPYMHTGIIYIYHGIRTTTDDGLIYTKKMITCIYHVFVGFHSVHNAQYKQQYICVTPKEKGQKTLV